MARLFSGLDPLLSDASRLDQPVLFARKFHHQQYQEAQSEPDCNNPTVYSLSVVAARAGVS